MVVKYLEVKINVNMKNLNNRERHAWKEVVFLSYVWMVYVMAERTAAFSIETSVSSDFNNIQDNVHSIAVEPSLTFNYGSRTTRSIKNRHGVDLIFRKFGNNDTLSQKQFLKLMGLLNIGEGQRQREKEEKCMGLDEIFSYYGYNGSRKVNKTEFLVICPSLVEQVAFSACEKGKKVKDVGTSMKSAHTGKVWGYGVLFVTIISLASMFGAFIVPFMNKQFYRKMLLFMVSLAVGVLSGSGIFHLLPHAFGMGKGGQRDYLWKCSVIIGGIYFFFITESLMKMYIRFSDWEREKKDKTGIESKTIENHGHGLPVSVDSLHDHHGLDSIHVTDKNCLHEHGMDSLHMAGEHQIEMKNTMDCFVKPNHRSNERKRIAPVAWMIILGDGLHNFIDGLAIGVAFANNIIEGISTSLAILAEELPHELGDFAILLNSGMTYKQAILCNFLSACTCYIGMIVGVILGQKTAAVKWVYALAAGMFLYISLVDMLPEACGMALTLSGTSRRETVKNFLIVNFAIIFGFVIMFILALYTKDIKL